MNLHGELLDYIRKSTTRSNRTFMEAVLSGYKACFENGDLDSGESSSEDKNVDQSAESGAEGGDDVNADAGATDGGEAPVEGDDQQQHPEQQQQQDPMAGANEQGQDVNAQNQQAKPQQRTPVSGEALLKGLVQEKMTDKVINVAQNSNVKVTKEAQLDAIINKGINAYIQGKNLQAPSEEVIKKLVNYFSNDVHKRIDQAKQKQQQNQQNQKNNQQNQQGQPQDQQQAQQG